jgi:hypothetical protein
MMGYWKRQYTERPTGKPLFRPDPRSAGPRTLETSDLADSSGSGGAEAAAPGAEPQQPGRQSAENPGQ